MSNPLSTNNKFPQLPNYVRHTDNTLSVIILIIVILLVISRSHIIHPLLIIQVPTNSFFNTFFELQTRPPALRRQRNSASPHFSRILSTSYKYLVRPTNSFWNLAIGSRTFYRNRPDNHQR